MSGLEDPGAAAVFIALILVGIAMYIIKWACDSFEPASDYLGTEVYNLAPGVRGASINAVASSLPELFTTLFLLFFFHDEDGFAAGIATCAGSAIFNGAVIPALCIIAVSTKGVNGEIVTEIQLRRATLARDGFFFLFAEIVFIFFLNSSTLSWWMGLVLMLIYVCYAVVLIKTPSEDDEDDDDDGDSVSNPMKRVQSSDDEKGDIEEEGGAAMVEGEGDGAADGEGGGDVEEDEKGGDGDGDGDDDDDDEKPTFFQALITFDVNELIYDGADFASSGQAWTVLLISTLIIAAACYVLAEAVMLSAKGFGVAPYFTAVILGAAASSVPDTYISYMDALKGDYDDAVANAIGSNIFDICFALGLPLFLYGLIYGDVDMMAELGSQGGGSEKEASEVQSLRILLIIASVVMLMIFFINKTGVDDKGRAYQIVGKPQAYMLFGLYAIWTLIIILQAAEVISF